MEHTGKNYSFIPFNQYGFTGTPAVSLLSGRAWVLTKATGFWRAAYIVHSNKAWTRWFIFRLCASLSCYTHTMFLSYSLAKEKESAMHSRGILPLETEMNKGRVFMYIEFISLREKLSSYKRTVLQPTCRHLQVLEFALKEMVPFLYSYILSVFVYFCVYKLRGRVNSWILSFLLTARIFWKVAKTTELNTMLHFKNSRHFYTTNTLYMTLIVNGTRFFSIL